MKSLHLREEISKRVRELRKEKRFTQEELAGRSGLSVDVIGKIERAETTPSVDTLHNLCNALRISIAEFLTFGTGDDVEEAAGRIYRYLLTKNLDQVLLAEKIIHAAVEHLEGEG